MTVTNQSAQASSAPAASLKRSTGKQAKGTTAPLATMTRSRFVTLDPAKKSSDITLSNGNLSVTKTSAAASPAGVAIATISKATGKWYMEWSPSVGGLQEDGIGLCNASMVVTNWAGSDSLSIGWYNDDSVFYNYGVLGAKFADADPFSNGDICAVAWDVDAGLIWFRNVTTGSFWNHSSLANPTNGTGGLTIGVTGALFPCVTVSAINNASTINFGATPFTGVIPTGFSSYGGTTIFSVIFQAITAPIAALARKGIKAGSSTTAPAATSGRSAGKIASAIAAQVASLLRTGSKVIFTVGGSPFSADWSVDFGGLGGPAQATARASISRQVAKSAPGSATQTSGLTSAKTAAKTQLAQATAAAASSSARLVGKIAQGTAASLTSALRATGKQIAALGAQSTALGRAITKTHTAASTHAPAVVISTISRAAATSASTAPAGSIVRALAKQPITAATAALASLAAIRAKLFAIQGAASANGTVGNRAGKGLLGASSPSATSGRAIAAMRQGGATARASVQNFVSHSLAGSAAAAASAAKATARTVLQGASTASASLIAVRRVLSASLFAAAAAAGSIARLPGKAVQAITGPQGSVRKAVTVGTAYRALATVAGRILALMNVVLSPIGASRKFTLRKKAPVNRSPAKGPWQL